MFILFVYRSDVSIVVPIGSGGDDDRNDPVHGTRMRGDSPERC